MYFVVFLRSIYTARVEPCLYSDASHQQVLEVHVIIPGPPDAPEIFLHSQEMNEIVIEWGEPRCYGDVKVKGYQVIIFVISVPFFTKTFIIKLSAISSLEKFVFI